MTYTPGPTRTTLVYAPLQLAVSEHGQQKEANSLHVYDGAGELRATLNYTPDRRALEVAHLDGRRTRAAVTDQPGDIPAVVAQLLHYSPACTLSVGVIEQAGFHCYGPGQWPAILVLTQPAQIQELTSGPQDGIPGDPRTVI